MPTPLPAPPFALLLLPDGKTKLAPVVTSTWLVLSGVVASERTSASSETQETSLCAANVSSCSVGTSATTTPSSSNCCRTCAPALSSERRVVAASALWARLTITRARSPLCARRARARNVFVNLPVWRSATRACAVGKVVKTLAHGQSSASIHSHAPFKKGIHSDGRTTT